MIDQSTIDEINRQVAENIDNDLKSAEEDIAKQFGAIKIESKDNLIEKAQEINNELAEEKSEATENLILPETEPPPKTKDSIIASIIELETSLGMKPSLESKLKRKKKADLEQMLASLFSKGTEKVAIKNEEGKSRDEVNSNVIVENLFTMNLILFGSLEKVSDKVKSQTYDVALLEGLTERLRETKSDLMEILKRVYADHKVILNKIATPIALYFTYITNQMVLTAYNNLEKKKQMSKGKD